MQKKTRKLTDFVKKPTGREEELAKSAGTTSSTLAEASQERSSEDLVGELIRVTIKRFEQQQRVQAVLEQESAKPPSTNTLPSTPATSARSTSELVELAAKLAEEAFKNVEVKIISCDKQGVCSDGKRIGEVFEDSSGIKWQRGFINTTRLPIFVDFVVEDASIEGRVGKALVLKSNRSAVAIVPEDYICELAVRYGIRVNLDKCINYRTSPWAEKSKARKK